MARNGVDRERRPILVTGMPRSGTSWVGKMLDASGRVVYINEPMNPKHPPGGSPGVLRAPIAHRFQYINADNESAYLEPFRETLSLKYHVVDELRQNHSPFDILRLIKYATSFAHGRIRRRRPLLDDPFAVFSAEWFARRFRCQVVVVVRHPAAIVSSRKRLGHRIDFTHFLQQPLLLRDWLAPFREDMERMVDRPDDVVGQGCLLWRMIYHAVADYRQRLDECYVVRHEDLSLDPLKEYAGLYRALALPFDDKVGAEIERATTGDAREKGHTWSLSLSGLSRTGFRPLDSRAHVKAWQGYLDRAEISRIHSLTDDVASVYYRAEDWG